jgi:hypothetical protein
VERAETVLLPALDAWRGAGKEADPNATVKII